MSRQAIAEAIAETYDDPLGFVLYAFPWGVPGTPLESFPLGPDVWSRRIFKHLTDIVRKNIVNRAQNEDLIPALVAVASGHGIGKSAMVAWLILWLMSTRKNCRGVVTANTGNQLENKTWPELSKWWQMSINQDWFEWTATKFYAVIKDSPTENPTANWKFDAVTWSEENTEAFAGMHNASSAVCFIFDEASAIADKIWEVADGGLTDGEPFWFAYGNPTRNTGRFKECFNGRFRDSWFTLNVDSREVRITNKTKLQTQIEQYGEHSDYVRVRIKGQFPEQGEQQLISQTAVEQAQQRQIMPDPNAPLIMGVDPARGGDKTVVRLRRGRDARSIPPVKWAIRNDMESTYRIAALIDEHQPDAVCIDAGAGTGIIDRLRELHYTVHEVWFGSKDSPRVEAVNVRTGLWLEMRDWMNTGAIDTDPDLMYDLINPEYKWAGTEGDQYQLESKKDMRARGLASTDDGDALAVTFAVKVARRDRKSLRRGKNHRIVDGGGGSGIF